MIQNNSWVIIWNWTNPAYCKTSHHALTFTSLSQNRQEQRRKKKYFSLQIVRKFTSHASQWKWIFGGQRSYLAFPGAWDGVCVRSCPINQHIHSLWVWRLVVHIVLLKWWIKGAFSLPCLFLTLFNRRALLKLLDAAGIALPWDIDNQ